MDVLSPQRKPGAMQRRHEYKEGMNGFQQGGNVSAPLLHESIIQGSKHHAHDHIQRDRKGGIGGFDHTTGLPFYGMLPCDGTDRFTVRAKMTAVESRHQ